MDRSTTREEYKAFMRKWRAVLAECGPADNFWKRDKSVRDSAMSIAFGAVYDVIPFQFWELRPQPYKHCYGAKESCGLLLNCKLAANSHPHKTRNP